MKSIEVQLLESLGHGIRPFNTGHGEREGLGLDQGFNFDAILRDARSGQAKTNLGVRFAPSVSGMFNDTDQFLIARGVDRASAAGVEHALILHGQRTLRVDVRNRVVLESTTVGDQRVIDGIDGFVTVKAPKKQSLDGESLDAQGEAIAPARVVRNASLVHALAGLVPD